MIHIACAANAAYVPHVAAMLHSLLSVQGNAGITVHFLYDANLEKTELERLRNFAIEQGAVWQGHLITEEQRARFPDNYHFGREAWYRTLLPELLPELERVLYLDADTIIRQSLEPLWQFDLQGHVIGAIANPLYAFMDNSFMLGLGVDSPDNYFNSGVILFDLQEWRAQNVGAELLQFIAEHGAAQAWPDQNTLNSVLRGRWMRLPAQWNMQNVYFELPLKRIPYPTESLRLARQNPAIVHYSAPYKPWMYMCKHPFLEDYLRHLSVTPWKGQAITGKTLRNRVLRLLPQPYQWLFMVYIRKFVRRLRRVLH